MPARSIVLKDKKIEFKLRKSPLSKCIRFSISQQGELSISAPSWIGIRQVEAAITDKQEWILEKIGTVKKSPLENIRFLGKVYPLRRVLSVKRPKAILKKDTIYIRVQDNSEKSLRTVLEKWYIKEAKRLFPELVEKHNKGYRINRIAIKNQKTRWGSCSNSRNLNFNWRLLMAPMEIVEYIVIHELAHLDEMSHSKNFWRIVASRCPGYKTHNRWLKANGPELIL